jgi:iron complex outermembrane recepter protein
MKTSLKYWLSGASVAMMALTTQTVYAQTTPAPAATNDQAIVVTARRRSENLQNVPVSVVVFNQQKLTDLAVHNATDLSRVAPGTSMQSTGASRVDTTFSIRGQGATFGTASGVVTYFADVPDFVASGTSPASIYDMSDLEVLKGPQGTLFGKNTTGGAVLFVPHPATDKFGGFIDARLGNYGRHDGEFALNIPIVGDKVDLRIAGQSLNRDGFTTYLLDGSKLDNENRQSFRVTLTVRPFAGFENTTIYQDAIDHENGGDAVLTAIHDSGGCVAGACGNDSLFPELQAELAEQQHLGIRTVLGGNPDHFIVRDSNGVINTTTWEVNDHLTFKNIASMRWYRDGQNYDLTGTNITLLNVDNPPETINTEGTEEIQAQLKFGSLSGVVGYYYGNSVNPYSVAYKIQNFNAQVIGNPLAFLGPTTTAEVKASGDTTSNGYYAQANWKATNKLTLTGGLRYTVDYVAESSETLSLGLPPGFPFVGPGPFANAQGVYVVEPLTALNTTFHALTWTTAANYAFNPNLDGYVTVRTGYKEGGFNATAQLLADRFYQPEQDIDYEIGLKGQHDFGNGVRTRFAIDGFYDDYSNIQRFENLPAVNNIPQTLTKNAAAAYIDGIDVDWTLGLSKYFQVQVNYTYMNAKYTKWDGGIGIGDLTNQIFPNTPTNQLTVTPKVTFPIPSEMGNLSLQSTIYYQSAIATDPFNRHINGPKPGTPDCAPPNPLMPNVCTDGTAVVNLDALGANLAGAYTRIDLRLDWNHIYNSPVSASLYVLNLTNANYIVGTGNQLKGSYGVVTALYGEPRFYGAELRYDF